MSYRLAVLAGALCVPATASAQHDYRNLDHGRPVTTEDAYPVERHALEVMVPWSHERHDGHNAVMFEPEVMWGAFLNGMVGLGAPIRLGDGGGLAGLRPFVFYNFNTESSLPALAVRLDGSVPLGALGGDDPAVALAGIATLSRGTTRLHLNGSRRITGGGGGPLEDAPTEWSVSVGVDHTLWRRSMVLVTDVERAAWPGGETSWIVGAGVRMQATPTMVLDVGGHRRLSPHGPDLVLTAGLTRAFSLAGGVE